MSKLYPVALLSALCGSAVPELLVRLKQEWESKIKAQAQGIQSEINRLADEEKRTSNDLSSLKRLQSHVYQAQHKLQQTRTEVNSAVGGTMTERDDPEAILKVKIAEIESRLHELEQALTQKQEKLSKIESELARADEIVGYLNLEERTRALEEIQSSDEFKQLGLWRDKAAEWSNDVEAVKAAIKEAAREQAKSKVNEAGNAIDNLFGKLADHPVLNHVKLQVTPDVRTGLSSYELQGPDGKDLTPVLSQGDLNALALAIFLGLASSSDKSRGFDLVILDDPSQSLGSQHKQMLATVLNEVADKKGTVIASTMDSEFINLLGSGITKAKITYHFTSWDGTHSPTFEKV